jgi:uncharacterized protein with HEPN domain
VNRIKRHFPEEFAKIPESEKIIGFRNLIAHGYDSIDSEILWDAIQMSVPKLIRAIEEFFQA